MVEFIKKNSKIEKIIIPRNGYIPNNEIYPVIIYRKIFAGSSLRLAKFIEKTITGNKWPNMWRSCIYSFHHYHSKTFEFVGCYSGSAKLQLGGEGGLIAEVNIGDAVVIPPGVAHKQISSMDNFMLVGGYPYGDYPDMMYCKKNEYETALKNIAKAFVANHDPVLGEKFRELLSKKDAKFYKFENNKRED
ncbi:cupin [Lentisphaerae bacterium WC36]|nr:cupin [Lentisphaerae bacterium WC36]